MKVKLLKKQKIGLLEKPEGLELYVTNDSGRQLIADEKAEEVIEKAGFVSRLLGTNKRKPGKQDESETQK